MFLNITRYEGLRQLKKLTLNYLKKRKVTCVYEEGKAPVKFVSKVEEYYHHLFYQAINMIANFIRNRFQQKDYSKTLQTMKMLLLKTLREEDFGHELQ